MEGGSLNSELHKYFNYDLNQITRSGFIKPNLPKKLYTD